MSEQVSVQDRVIDIIAEQFGTDSGEITLETKLLQDFNADDLDLAELQIAFEDEFEITVPDGLCFSDEPQEGFGNDPDNVEVTVGQIIAGIEKGLQGRKATVEDIG